MRSLRRGKRSDSHITVKQTGGKQGTRTQAPVLSPGYKRFHDTVVFILMPTIPAKPTQAHPD